MTQFMGHSYSVTEEQKARVIAGHDDCNPATRNEDIHSALSDLENESRLVFWGGEL